jgi:hypothetical protein
VGACNYYFLPDRTTYTLSSDLSLVRLRSREEQWRDNNGGEACDDLKFQDTDRILHRHAALPSLEGALQIRSLQALPQELRRH